MRDGDSLVRSTRDGYNNLSRSLSWSGLLTAGDVPGEIMLLWGDTVGPSVDKTDPTAWRTPGIGVARLAGDDDALMASLLPKAST